MIKSPWLSIVGLGEDGPDGLSVASVKAIENAEIIMGPPRHLGLLNSPSANLIEWPVPFADGIETLMSLRGKQVVVLASGDPFWYGAGSVITRQLRGYEWQAFPAPSSFSLAASRLGWSIEKTECIGLHAAPFSRLRPLLSDGGQAIVTLRDGSAVEKLAAYLVTASFGRSTLHVLEALGGPNERIRSFAASDPALPDVLHPVCVAIEMSGHAELPLASGRSDALFENDGQITKRPVRALTLSALAPKRGEHLLDIGGGSGSISIEWLLSHHSMQATVIEANHERAARIKTNAASLGVDRLNVVEGIAPSALSKCDKPDAVFIGGGLSDELLTSVTQFSGGTRLVANAVTLESEALLIQWQAKIGGDLLRIELSNLGNIGKKRGWKAAYPLVQWSVTL
jgi:precorrin-6B C5,15-methyltransferase / cobalt-precorrin-6B C5,C15-methyltransferase